MRRALAERPKKRPNLWDEVAAQRNPMLNA